MKLWIFWFNVALVSENLIKEVLIYVEEFVHLISSEANEICDKEKKKTMAPEHILKALQV